MVFPQTPHDLRAEMQIGGEWTDITGDLYARTPVTIQRGRQDEGQRVGTSKATFELNNRQAAYSGDNPRSANFGRIGRNTPVRFSLPGSESYLALDGESANTASTPDHASLAITDIDVRVEVTIDWYAQGLNQALIGQWGADGNRGWTLRVLNSQVAFLWSPDGTSANSKSLTWNLPALPRRAALRFTLDVNNGSGGYDAAIYWGPTVSGPWSLFEDFTGSATTSIFNSTAALEIAPTQAGTNPLRKPFVGRGHRFEVRSGIGGTVVASPDFTTQTPGATGFTDSAGRVWTINGNAEISNRQYRVAGEVSYLPTRWDLSGNDVYVPVEASGILRRLGQGAKELASTLRRRIPTFSPVAYWPMEDGREATQAYSPLVGVNPLKTTGLEYGSDDTCPGSSSLPKVAASATLRGTVPPYSSSTGFLVAFIYALDSPPASASVLLDITTSGTAKRVVVTLTSTQVQLRGYDAAGSTVLSHDGLITGFTGAGTWFRFDLSATQDGSDVDWHMGWVDVEGGGFQSNTTASSATAGTVRSVQTSLGSLLAGMRLGHLTVLPTPDLNVWGTSDNGYRGETAGARMLRLGSEEGVPIAVDSPTSGGTRLGPQRPNPLLTLLDECADADLGVLYEDRDRIGLRFRDRATYYNQTPALVLDYAADGEVAPPLEPVHDDQHVRNDRTVTREGGSSARAVDTTSALSVQAPPAGVGTYDDQVTLNLYDDSQPENVAGWLLHMGTWDEARYPTVRINLAAAPHLVDTVLGLDIGDRIQIINPPTWLPPGPIDLIIEGYTEVFGHPNDWDIAFNCSPAGPWTVAVADDEDARADTSGCVLATSVDSDDTNIVVTTTAGPLWTTDPVETPWDVRMGGEVMTVTRVNGPVQDRYGRTVTSGWGVADSGQTWTTTGGSASDYSVLGA